MKAMLALFLVLPALSFASNVLEVEGTKAAALMKALKQAKVPVFCSEGICTTKATDVQCLLTGHSVGEFHFACTLTAQNKVGALEQLQVEAQAAEGLQNALEAAGVDQDCGA